MQVQEQREAPPPFDFDQASLIPKAVKSVRKWCRKNSQHLPRTREALIHAIKPLCSSRMKVLEVDYVLQKLIQENYIEVDEEGDVFLVDRKFQGFPPAGDDLPYHFTHDLHEAQRKVLFKNFEWVATLTFPPNSLENLKASLVQRNSDTFTVEPHLVVDELCQKKVISIDQDKKVTYHLLLG